MRQMVEKLLNRFGTQMALCRGKDRWEIYGFFQAVKSRSWQNMEQVATPLGEISRGQYTYLGPAGIAREGDTLEVGQKRYLFRRVEPYYYGGEAIYQWGLCVEKGVEDTWGA